VVQEYDLKEIAKSASEQKYELKANVSYDERQKAKDRRFHWYDEEKSWVKTVKESEKGDEIKACDFEVLWRKKGAGEVWKK